MNWRQWNNLANTWEKKKKKRVRERVERIKSMKKKKSVTNPRHPAHVCSGCGTARWLRNLSMKFLVEVRSCGCCCCNDSVFGARLWHSNATKPCKRALFEITKKKNEMKMGVGMKWKKKKSEKKSVLGWIIFNFLCMNIYKWNRKCPVNKCITCTWLWVTSENNGFWFIVRHLSLILTFLCILWSVRFIAPTDMFIIFFYWWKEGGQNISEWEYKDDERKAINTHY